MKLFIMQTGILAGLVALLLAAVPVHTWDSLSWRGRAVDNVTRFHVLPHEHPWIQQFRPVHDDGFNVTHLKLDRSKHLTLAQTS